MVNNLRKVKKSLSRGKPFSFTVASLDLHRLQKQTEPIKQPKGKPFSFTIASLDLHREKKS